jgi:hypothetical protein
MNGERGWRLNALLTVSLGVALFLVLIVRPPFQRPPIAVPTGLAAMVESGTTGAQTDESGVYWWITEPNPTIRIVNYEGKSAAVQVVFVLINGPCPVGRDVAVDGRVVELAPGGSANVLLPTIELDRYERRELSMRITGGPCPSTEVEPRELYVRVGDLRVRELEP